LSDNFVIKEAREPVAQYVGRNALWSSGKVFESSAAEGEVADDEHAPPVTNDIQGER
jgi:hypothetical protein